jgi:hypothetical protein
VFFQPYRVLLVRSRCVTCNADFSKPLQTATPMPTYDHEAAIRQFVVANLALVGALLPHQINNNNNNTNNNAAVSTTPTNNGVASPPAARRMSPAAVPPNNGAAAAVAAALVAANAPAKSPVTPAAANAVSSPPPVERPFTRSPVVLPDPARSKSPQVPKASASRFPSPRRRRRRVVGVRRPARSAPTSPRRSLAAHQQRTLSPVRVGQMATSRQPGTPFKPRFTSTDAVVCVVCKKPATAVVYDPASAANIDLCADCTFDRLESTEVEIEPEDPVVAAAPPPPSTVPVQLRFPPLYPIEAKVVRLDLSRSVRENIMAITAQFPFLDRDDAHVKLVAGPLLETLGEIDRAAARPSDSRQRAHARRLPQRAAKAAARHLLRPARRRPPEPGGRRDRRSRSWRAPRRRTRWTPSSASPQPVGRQRSKTDANNNPRQSIDSPMPATPAGNISPRGGAAASTSAARTAAAAAGEPVEQARGGAAGGREAPDSRQAAHGQL